MLVNEKLGHACVNQNKYIGKSVIIRKKTTITFIFIIQATEVVIHGKEKDFTNHHCPYVYTFHSFFKSEKFNIL